MRNLVYFLPVVANHCIKILESLSDIEMLQYYAAGIHYGLKVCKLASGVVTLIVMLSDGMSEFNVNVIAIVH